MATEHFGPLEAVVEEWLAQVADCDLGPNCNCVGHDDLLILQMEEALRERREVNARIAGAEGTVTDTAHAAGCGRFRGYSENLTVFCRPGMLCEDCSEAAHKVDCTDDELPGMWENADLSGGWADSNERAEGRTT